MRVLVSDRIAEEGIELLRQGADVDVRVGLSPDGLRSIIADYDGLVVRSETKVTAQIIDAAARLQVIGRAGVGVDNIDLEAASRRGIVVVNAPTANTIAAAEHAIALMLSLARRVPQACASLRGGEWQRSRFVGVEVRGKTLGVIGLGRIGAEVAKRAQGLLMEVVAYDPFTSADHAARLGITIVPLEDLLRTSDFVTLHTPLTPATRGMLGARELSLMRPTAYVINCARGGLIDEDALYEALETGRLAGAALDVFAQEPPGGSRLLQSEKVICTPHLGASTREAQVGVAVDVANQVLAVLRGEPVRYAVNAPALSPEALAALGAYLPVAEVVGSLFSQLQEGQLGPLEVVYNGDIALLDTAPLTAAVLKGLLQPVSEEHVTLMNAMLIARGRGLTVSEKKTSESVENYTNLITLRTEKRDGVREVAGTMVHGRPHIVRLNDYRVDVEPNGGYVLIAEHTDRPGMIGKVGTIMGKADINISSMQVGRSTARGPAMMVLALDDPIPDQVLDEVSAIEDIGRIRVVRL